MTGRSAIAEPLLQGMLDVPPPTSLPRAIPFQLPSCTSPSPAMSIQPGVSANDRRITIAIAGLASRPNHGNPTTFITNSTATAVIAAGDVWRISTLAIR